MAVVNEGGHHALGIDRFILRLELFSGQNVDRNFFERQSLEPKRNPHTKRSNRPPESVDLYAHRETPFA